MPNLIKEDCPDIAAVELPYLIRQNNGELAVDWMAFRSRDLSGFIEYLKHRQFHRGYGEVSL